MEPIFTSIDQLGFVVRDMWACLGLLCDSYGIGPWRLVRFGGKGGIVMEKLTVEGAPVEGVEILVATCDLPQGIQLELIQPLAGDGLFSRYLRRHGPGLQHLSVVTPDFDRALAQLQTLRVPLGQRAWIDNQEDCVFADLRSSLGVYLELHKRAENFRFPDVECAWYPESGLMPQNAAPLISVVDQVGMAARSLEDSLTVLWNTLGLGPWMLLNFGDLGDNSVSVENVVLNGRAVPRFGQKIAICEAVNLQLELIEPVVPAGIIQTHLDVHGTDVQHISVVTSGSYEDALARIQAAGYTGGQVCTIDGTETCNYVDHTDLLGVCLELHRRPDPFVPPQVRLETYPADAIAGWK